MAAALTAAGIEVEVFVPSASSGVLDFGGVRVQRVLGERSLVARGAARVASVVAGSRGDLIVHLMNARRLTSAVEERHRELPFDVIQSSNHNLTGYYLERSDDRVHLVRISTSRRLYDQERGRRAAFIGGVVEALDVRGMRRADAVYAPSAFLAEHFRRMHGLDVHVVRPPAELGAVPAESIDAELPARYLVHFGSLGERKGTDAIAQALPQVWASEPGVRMVWVGQIADAAVARFRSAWGPHASNVTILGPRAKPDLYRVVLDAAASVLPSTVDNLPNTVIESLALGVPVIGSAGASIDELVEPGTSGLLVPIGDTRALAQAMIQVWRSEVPWSGGSVTTPATLAAMRPDRAVQAFLDLASDARARSARARLGPG
jgi:glycogen synthase